MSTLRAGSRCSRRRTSPSASPSGRFRPTSRISAGSRRAARPSTRSARPSAPARREVPQHAHRVELIGHRGQEAALPGHPRVVVRVLPRPDVGERLAAVEVVAAAGLDVDPRLRLAPCRPRHLVDEPLLDEDPDTAEPVDEIGEAAQVDERVVVDPDAEQARDRLLERRRPGIAATREETGQRSRIAVEPVQRLLGSASAFRGARRRAAPRPGSAGSRRPPPGRSRAGSRRGSSCPSARPVARPLVGPQQEDRRPRLALHRLTAEDLGSSRRAARRTEVRLPRPAWARSAARRSPDSASAAAGAPRRRAPARGARRSAPPWRRRSRAPRSSAP